MARTILVADDSPTIQKKASGILTGEGLDVVTVSNGVAAVKKLPALKPLVVLADVSMPGKDGYEVCEFVKKSDELRHVAVLLVFSDLEPYEAERGARVAADGTIRKPFDHNELIATVQKFLAQAEAAAPRAVAAPPPPKPESEPTYVTEPVDEEPVVEERPPEPDLAAFTGGVAFGAPMPSEEFAVVEPEPPAPMVFEPTAPAEPPAETAEVAAAPEVVEEPVAEEPPPTEPTLVEEEAAPPPEPQFETPESTMRFRAPADIAAPVLSEEPESALVEASTPPAEEEAPPPEPEEAPIAANTLESYTLTEAAEGQVRFGAGAEAPPPVEEAAAPVPEPQAPPAAPAPGLDRERVYEIIHKVVARMSPPAFPAEAIEGLARKFADEIYNELGL